MSSIFPDCDMKRWEYCDNTVVLANADYYYTKEQVDKKIEDVEGMTQEDVQKQIDESIKDKADKSEVNELAQKVSENAQRILNTYTKNETNSLLQAYLTKLEANSMVANYAKVDGNILTLNSNNII